MPAVDVEVDDTEIKLGEGDGDPTKLEGGDTKLDWLVGPGWGCGFNCCTFSVIVLS